MKAYEEYGEQDCATIEALADRLYDSLVGNDANLVINALAHVMADVCARNIDSDCRDGSVQHVCDYIRALVPDYVEAKHSNHN